MPTPIGLVGLGKIARAQHLPAIEADPRFMLAATVDQQSARLETIPSYTTLEAMFDSHPTVAAVVICTPPQVRAAVARAALSAGRHVMLEKPPSATCAELAALRRQADIAGLTLFAAWHSVYGAAVPQAQNWIAMRSISQVAIVWREDVRVWHPGQQWIWRAGGFGVFDPGSNALSILCRLLPHAPRVVDAVFSIPANCQEPIAASLRLVTACGAPITAMFDFRSSVDPEWSITVHADDGGVLTITDGGNQLAIDCLPVAAPPQAEYPSLYARFAELIASRASDVEATPLHLIEECYRRATCVQTEAFHDG